MLLTSLGESTVAYSKENQIEYDYFDKFMIVKDQKMLIEMFEQIEKVILKLK